MADLVEDVAEAGLKAFTATSDVLPSNGHAPIVSSKEVVNGHGLDKSEGSNVSDILQFDDIGANIDEHTDAKHDNVHETNAIQNETGESSGNAGEVVEEEIVELEFEKVKPKLDTHSMHCPNCKSEVTKVILRRKVLNYRPLTKPVVSVEPPQPDPEDLVGCFSCLSLFTCSDNGCFNPFDIFRKRPETSSDSTSLPKVEEKAKVVVRENESCLSMFWVIGKGQNDQKLEKPQQVLVFDDREFQSPYQAEPPKYVTGTSSSSVATGTTTVGISSGTKNGLLGATRPSFDLPESSSATGNDDTTINIETESKITTVVAQPRGRSWLGQDGLLVEILKSIIYGGLMEVIASLSVVASAAASDATTLSIVALALASVAGGVFVIGHNLWDLRDDCHKETSSEQTTNEASNKYKELLGQINYFPLHAFVSILSFLVFGMVPPVAYGYSFHETNDKDYTLVVVAIASLLCVSLLAIFKAYINKCKVFDYFKTVVYYITTAVSVSGVSYVVGNLVTRLINEYGLLDACLGGDKSLLPQATNPSFASF